MPGWIAPRRRNDPTPKDPIGLALAAADTNGNVLYMARPCQYSGLADGRACPQKYWTDARLAPETILAMNAVMDDFARRNNVRSFALTGYSGGGGAAVLLAARRHDVISGAHRRGVTSTMRCSVRYMASALWRSPNRPRTMHARSPKSRNFISAARKTRSCRPPSLAPLSHVKAPAHVRNKL